MAKKNNNALFFTCSLIEYIGRSRKLERREVVQMLGKERIQRIYDYADVFHCEPMEKVAEEFTEEAQIPVGTFDNVKECRYEVPDYWTIGEVYERLIEDAGEDQNIVDTLLEVYTSWIDRYLSDYNIAVYYQSREYIAACYQEGEIL